MTSREGQQSTGRMSGGEAGAADYLTGREDAHAALRSGLVQVFSNPHLWAIFAITLVLGLIYYGHLLHLDDLFPFASDFFEAESLHELQRVLLLVPMLYAGFVFRTRGALLATFACFWMVFPRALFISPNPDSLARTLVFVGLAGLATVMVGVGEGRRQSLKKTYAKLDLAHSGLNQRARQLQEAEERYRNLFEFAADAIMVSDFAGNIIEVNQAAVGLTGYSSEELKRMNLATIVKIDGPVGITEKQSMWLKCGAAAERCEELLYRKDGSKVIVDVATRQVTKMGSPSLHTIVRDITEEKRLKENLQFYVREITQAQEEERKRIARELHDETAQGLALLALDIERIERQPRLAAATLERLQKLRTKTEAMMEGVSRFSHELRPAVLDHLGLAPALEWLASEMSVTHGIPTLLEVKGEKRRLDPHIELVLFRIAQEALNNVRRHSGASKAEVVIEFEPQRLKFQVTDNGMGFELPKALGDFASRGKLGILGMQERAKIIGAQFSFKSGAGQGTKVSVDLAI